MRIDQGPHQRLVRAQEQLYEALSRGTNAQIKDTQEAFNRASDAVSKLTAQVKAVAKPPPQPAAGLKITGPYQRLQKARQDLQKAVAQGIEAQILDAGLQVKAAENALSKAFGPSGVAPRLSAAPIPKLAPPPKPPAGPAPPKPLTEAQQQRAQAQQEAQARRDRAASPMGRIGQLIASTRLNLGPASPLIGRAAGAVNAVAPGAGGPLLLGLGALSLAVTAITAVFNVLKGAVETVVGAIRTAAEALSALHAAALQSGDRGGATSFLASVGIKPDQIPGLSSGLRQTAASSPSAMMARNQMGLPVALSRELAPGADEASFTKQIIQSLAAIQDPAQRFAQAVRMDATALLPAIDFYARHRAAIDADAAAMQAIADPATQQAGADLVSQLERVRQQFLAVIMALAKPFLKPLGDMIGRFADSLRDLATWINANGDSLKVLGDELLSVTIAVLDFGKAISYLIALVGREMQGIPALAGLGKDLEILGKAGWAGASALQKVLTGAGAAQAKAGADFGNHVDQFGNYVKQGTYGGGPRARGALPSGLRGMAFQMGVEGQAIRSGAFVL